jgi:spore germination cell wall hydrolase CwlJ-like protein
MALAISNHYYERVISATKVTMLLLGFAIIAMLLTSVTKNKLNHLRSELATQDQVVITAAERTKQLDCLTKNIYWEAASEPFEGKVAVAQVTMNRVKSGRFGEGVCGVVYQKNVFYQKVICQFSWACETAHKTKPIYAKLYAESEEAAKKVLLEGFRLTSLNEALYYHASYVNPGWRKQRINQIGQHIFYKE